MNRIKNQEVEQQQENVAKPIKKNSNEGLTRKFINAINNPKKYLKNLYSIKSS